MDIQLRPIHTKHNEGVGGEGGESDKDQRINDKHQKKIFSFAFEWCENAFKPNKTMVTHVRLQRCSLFTFYRANCWLIELPYWLKAGFLLKFWGIFSMRDTRDNFVQDEIEPKHGQIKHKLAL